MYKKLVLNNIDKIYHFLSAYFLTTICLPLAIVCSVGKEVFDYSTYGKKTKGFFKMAVGDLLFDGLGILFGILIIGAKYGFN